MLSVASYYKVRSLCHQLKDGDKRAIYQSASLLSRHISPKDTVIPMPSHNGKATYMLQVAKLISKQTGAQVLDILSSTPHEPWYNTKLQNGINTGLNYSFNVDNNAQPQGIVYIIDNVYSTGKTMKAAVNKIKQMYPKKSIQGLVLGVVDKKTVQQLNYGPDLHENRIGDVVKETIEHYLKENINYVS